MCEVPNSMNRIEDQEQPGDMLEKAMAYLVFVEPGIDDWNYPIGMKEEVKKLLDDYYGEGIRPE